ncbi:unnamed protein product [Coffea canephora]|uniref:Receptor-like serine/threonine-protein kinase n=1 Tax=Coffea canephora TaxID=49390 RepID=A0A068TPT8_COFCA|nr:unnamed protein product [Coffea canephora]
MAAVRKINLVTNFLCCCFLLNHSCYSEIINDTILQGEELRDWQQLVSASNFCRLQFFSPGSSRTRYLGIFLNQSPDDLRPVWIANRDNPIPDASGSLKIAPDGRLNIYSSGGSAIALSSAPSSAGGNVSVTLLDNGNLVLRELYFNGSFKQTLWQSFDYPTNTLLPGMKIGINLRTGHRWSLVSPVSQDQVPASGPFILGIDQNGTGQLMIWWREKVVWNSGIWLDGHFACANPDYINFTFVSDGDEKSFVYTSNTHNRSMTTYKLEPTCWITEEGLQVDLIGCYTIDDYNLSLFDCKATCVENCSCFAYASITDNETGCEFWSQSMHFMTTSGRQVFIRSESLKGWFLNVKFSLNTDDYSSTKWWPWLLVALGVLLAFGTLCWMLLRKYKARGTKKSLLDELGGRNMTPETNDGKANKDEIPKSLSKDLLLFSFDSITAATNNFSITSKLGEGGFGPVYKGKLEDGQEVAIKRLSKNSGQGVVEFKNEILLIAKLQHRNLARLLGCCLQADEKILVYEYMVNRSLDFLLFDSSKKELLKWSIRLNIIEGIAQGLLYLHKYSRLRVIHRDLKAGNILLDDSMNPKISDFGLARIFGMQESEAKTKRIVGTYGYMSPEYAIKGIVSMKTDVFSFGVLLLEIVSGRKNNSCYHSEHPLNLVGMAWELWKEGRALELMDPMLNGSCPENEVTRCIQVGLLCVQDRAIDRPSMSDVVSMLSNEAVQLPPPKQPAFFIETVPGDAEKDKEAICSLNGVSISATEPR